MASMGAAGAAPGGGPTGADEKKVAGSGANQGTSLYVGDLGKDVTEQDLYTLFQTMGKLSSVKIPKDNATRVSLGYAYVNFVDAESAAAAMEHFNYTEIKKKPCRIMPAQRDPFLRKSGVGNVCLKNVPSNITTRTVWSLCKDFSESNKGPLSVKLPLGTDGKPLGFAFVQFDSEKAAETAIEMLNGETVAGPAGEPVALLAEKYVRKEQRSKGAAWTNLLVRSVPKAWTESDLTALFSKHGEITSAKISVGPDGVSRGMAFVNYVSNAEAEAAIKALDGFEVGGADQGGGEGEGAAKAEGSAGEAAAPPVSVKLSVVRHQMKADRMREQAVKWRAAKGLAADASKASNLYVKNLPADDSDDSLRKLFAPFGTITSAKVMKDKDSGISRGFGFVSFSSREEAQAAQESLHKKTQADGRPLYVGWFHDKASRENMALARKSREQQQAQTAQANRGFAAAAMPGQGMGGYSAAGAGMGGMGYPSMGYPGMGGMAGMGGMTAQNQQQMMMWLAQMMQQGQGGPFMQQQQQQAAMGMQGLNGAGAAGGQGPRPVAAMMGGTPSHGQPPMMGAGQAGAAVPRPAVGGVQGGARPVGGVVVQGQPPRLGVPVGMGQGVPVGMGSMAPRGYPGAPMQVGMQGARPGMPGPQGQGAPRSFAAAAAAPRAQGGMGQGMPGAVMAQGQAHGPFVNEFLTQLASASKTEQRNMLGEQLYPRIAAHDSELAGKITGMLLELDVQELVNLLDDQAALDVKVAEAKDVLKKVNFQKAQARNS